MNEGLSKYDVIRELREKIDADPDLKYFMNNEYVARTINLLIEGIGEVMEQNNRELMHYLMRR